MRKGGKREKVGQCYEVFPSLCCGCIKCEATEERQRALSFFQQPSIYSNPLFLGFDYLFRAL